MYFFQITDPSPAYLASQVCNDYVHNPAPVLATRIGAHGRLNLTTQPHLRGTAHTTAVYTCLAGGAQCGRGGLAFFTAVSSVREDREAADGWAAGQASAAAALGADALRASHRRWWAAWWPRGGFVTFEHTVTDEHAK